MGQYQVLAVLMMILMTGREDLTLNDPGMHHHLPCLE